MKPLIPMDIYGVFADNQDTVRVNSLFVANFFEKRHDDVLKSIRNLDCSEDFRLRNFAESSYKNEQGRKQPCVDMTRDGFTFLVMGYRGKKAAKFKELYIKRLRDTSEYKSIISKELHEPIRKATNEYINSGAIDEAVKECIKEKTRWDHLTYYEAFKSEVEAVVDKKIKHFESKLEEAINNRIELRVSEITEEVISQIYKNSSFADFVDKEKVSKKIVELLSDRREENNNA